MKRVFALLLCVMLVVACFSGCGEKTIQYHTAYGLNKGFTHNHGNLLKLDVGFYQVTIYEYRDASPNEISYTPGWLEVYINEDGEKHFELRDGMCLVQEAGVDNAIYNYYNK